ncbi:indole-3-glycerol phosphate synthase TrpC [Marinicrinis sediminis]|uniref:Indole-3-glycerol phosphate synthase n=1 Tax=Marinicrinis sediminis TaxID=1652465 RepID=A0ABW5RDU2_9BACL
MFLDRIVQHKLQEVEHLKATHTIAQLEAQSEAVSAPRGFIHALTETRHRQMGLIAEVKKASPSKGLIREDFHPVQLAQAYEKAGADCISVLTDVSFFQGANAYLTEIREAVQLPLLRKDFIIDPVQVYEARAIGADAILLIAAILSKQEMKELKDLAEAMKMDVLVEVHNQAELETVLELDTKLIGINNRNLQTFVTDLQTTSELSKLIPADRCIISESGISAREDIAYLQENGASGLLIGEHFMRQGDVETAVTDLLGDWTGMNGAQA